MFIPNWRHCLLVQRSTSFVLNVSKSYTLCLLALTQLNFLVKSAHQRVFLSFYLYI
ncbi:hypothetical protein Hanom_Chr03g00233331 [Helianthus anomalus]